MTHNEWLRMMRIANANRTQGEWTIESDEYEDLTIPELISIQEGCAGSTQFSKAEDAKFIALSANQMKGMLDAIEGMKSALVKIALIPDQNHTMWAESAIEAADKALGVSKNEDDKSRSR